MGTPHSKPLFDLPRSRLAALGATATGRPTHRSRRVPALRSTPGLDRWVEVSCDQLLELGDALLRLDDHLRLDGWRASLKIVQAAASSVELR